MKGKGEQSEDETRNEQPDNTSNAFEIAIKQSIEMMIGCGRMAALNIDIWFLLSR